MTARTLVAFVMLATASSSAFAQSQESGPQPGPAPLAGMAELRLGGLWPQAPLVVNRPDEAHSTTSFAGGAQFGFNFRETLDGRLGLHFIVDYARLGTQEYQDDVLGLVRREGHWYVFTPALSLDVLRTSHVAAGVRAGPSIVGEITNFLLERGRPSCTYVLGTTQCDEPFENVCDLTAFMDRCVEQDRAALALGGAIRWHPQATWPLYVGIDYTWLSHGRHVLVFTIGARSRR